MLKNLTPERAINITRLSVLFTFCWPPPPNASRKQVKVFKAVRTGAVINAVTIFMPMAYGAYCHSNNPSHFVRSFSMTISVSQIFFQTLVAAANYDKIQQLIEEMTVFCKTAKREEREVLQKYIEKCGLFHGVCIVWFYVSGVVVVLSTLQTGGDVPPNVEYPFDVDYFPLDLFVLLHQFIVATQTIAHVCMNVFGALLLWFSAARFEILMREFREVTDISGLKTCIIKYYEDFATLLFRFAKGAAVVVRFIAFITILVTTMTTILCGVNLLSNDANFERLQCLIFLFLLFEIEVSTFGLVSTIGTFTLFWLKMDFNTSNVQKQPMGIKLQFIFIIALGFLEVFLCAWPADRLIELSTETCQTAYKSAWYLQGLRFQKSLLCALSPQTPVIVSVGCFMPTLSLSYYCSYLSNAFSAFTSLRVMIGDEDEE